MIKKIKKVGWKIFFTMFERKFYYNEHVLRYLFVNNHTKNLCVVFSAFPDKNMMPGYNLVRTLVPNNRNFSYLFILDDMVNTPGGGSYYLGSGGDYYGMDLVNTFLKDFISKYHFTSTVAVGSSKAGTAALMFGLPMHMNYLIIGACQYKIGTYLNCKYHMNTLMLLTGYDSVLQSVISDLDRIVPDIVLGNKDVNKTKIFFIILIKNTHIKDISMPCLLIFMGGYTLVEDMCDYMEHSDVKYFFSRFLLQSLEAIERELGI